MTHDPFFSSKSQNDHQNPHSPLEISRRDVLAPVSCSLAVVNANFLTPCRSSSRRRPIVAMELHGHAGFEVVWRQSCSPIASRLRSRAPRRVTRASASSMGLIPLPPHASVSLPCWWRLDPAYRYHLGAAKERSFRTKEDKEGVLRRPVPPATPIAAPPTFGMPASINRQHRQCPIPVRRKNLGGNPYSLNVCQLVNFICYFVFHCVVWICMRLLVHMWVGGEWGERTTWCIWYCEWSGWCGKRLSRNCLMTL
jgi:hypothetical protein